jgi:hypothetical protein
MKNIKIFLGLLIFLISCSPEFIPTPVPQINTKRKFNCTIGGIPDYINNQIYKDSDEKYDHRAQIKELCNLKNEGKEIYVIMGRGNAEIGKGTLDTKNGKRIWVYASSGKDKIAKNSFPHLWMDFFDDASLKSIPEGLFDGIAFDYFEIAFHPEKSIEQLVRLLDIKGKLFISTLWYNNYVDVGMNKYDQACADSKKFITKSGRNYCFTIGDGVVILGGFYPFLDSDKIAIENTFRVLVKGILRKGFGPHGCEIKSTGYPVSGMNLEYFECTKEKIDDSRPREKRKVYFKRGPGVGLDFDDSIVKALVNELGNMYEFIECDDGQKPCAEVEIIEPVLLIDDWRIRKRLIGKEYYGNNNNHVAVIISTASSTAPMFRSWLRSSARKGEYTPVINIRDGKFISGKDMLIKELELW